MKDDATNKYSRKGIEIYNHRMIDRFWGIREFTSDGKRTANATKLMTGDKVLFYLAGKDGHCFLGTCVLASGFRRLGEDEAKKRTHEEYLDWNQGVDFIVKDGDKWEKPLPIECLRGKVSFVPIRGGYGHYLQGSITKIEPDDYDNIIREHEN